MRRRTASLVHLVLGAVLLHAVVRFGFKIFYYLRSPWSRDYGEGSVLALVQLLAERGTYFVSLRDYPLVSGLYPPVFIALVWPSYALFGASLFFPRLLSALATLGLLALLFAIHVRLTGDRALSLALSLLFLAPWFVQTWAPLGRVDMLALGLSLGGLFVFLRGGEAPGPRRYLAFPLFWLAFLTKQNTLLAPAAVLVYLWLDRGGAAAGRALLAFVLPLLTLLGLLVAATRGEAGRHLFPYVASADYEWARMAESYGEFALIAAPLAALIVAGVALLKRDLWRGLTRLFVLYWLLSVLALTSIAKEGAGQNYFIEPWLATLLLAGAVLHALAERWPDMRAWRWPSLLVAALVASFASPGADRLPQAIRNPEGARDLIELDRVVRETAGPMLSENLSVLVTNRKPVLLDPFTYLLLVRAGRVRPERLLFDCERGGFELIVTEYRLRDIPGFSDCLDHRYYAWKDLGPYQLFRPRPRTP